MTEHVFTQSTTTTPTTLEWSDYTPDGARGALRAWIAEATRDAAAAAAIEDYRLDLITEAARRRDLEPALVRIWIFDFPEHEWTPGHLVKWALARGFTATTPEDIERDTAAAAAANFARQLRTL